MFIFIKFILNITDNFFHNIFEGDDTGGTAKLIYNHGKVYSVISEIIQQVINQFMLMHVICRAYKGVPVKVI
ncbi:hypothetical protein D9M68_971120 [compost metagenome]